MTSEIPCGGPSNNWQEDPVQVPNGPYTWSQFKEKLNALIRSLLEMRNLVEGVEKYCIMSIQVLKASKEHEDQFCENLSFRN